MMAGSQGFSLVTSRLDSYYGWLPWPTANEPAGLAYLPDLCQPALTSLQGSWVLVGNASREGLEGSCTYTTIIRNAEVGAATHTAQARNPPGGLCPTAA
jgi:hypothetical protein